MMTIELDAPPRRPREPIFDRLMIERALVADVWMAALALAVFAWQLAGDVPLPHARNMLLLMVLMQKVVAFNARSGTRSAFTIPVCNNPLLFASIAIALAVHVAGMNVPFMQTVLRMEPAIGTGWVTFPLLALSLLAVLELHKRSWRQREQAPATAAAAPPGGKRGEESRP